MARWRNALLRVVEKAGVLLFLLFTLVMLLALLFELLGWKVFEVSMAGAGVVMLRIVPVVLLGLPTVPLLTVLPGPPADPGMVKSAMTMSFYALVLLPVFPWVVEWMSRPEFCLYGVWAGCAACWATDRATGAGGR